MIRATGRFLAAVAMVAITVGIGSAANAAPKAQTAQEQSAAVAAACNGDPVNRFGKDGCKKRGTDEAHCYIIDHWEWFHVAPSGTIWHIWNGASSFKEMPHDGEATNMFSCWTDGIRDGVVVSYGNSRWYSYQYPSPANTWYGWYRL